MADKKFNTGWKYFPVTWADCPHLFEGRKKAMRDALIKQYGENSPFIQSMIYGKFFRTGGFFIFDPKAINDAMSGILTVAGKDRKGAVDLSGGGDEVVFGVREGNTMLEMEGKSERDTAKTSRWLETKFKQWELKAHQIRMDEGGLGQPIIDELEYRGWRGIARYNFDAKPRDASKYDTRAMEDHHRLSMRMENREINLVSDEKLAEQMRKRKFLLPNKNGGVMSLEPKKIIRRRGDPSPDRLDMAIMLYSDLPFYSKEDVRVAHTFMGHKVLWEDLDNDGGRSNVCGGMRMEE